MSTKSPQSTNNTAKNQTKNQTRNDFTTTLYNEEAKLVKETKRLKEKKVKEATIKRTFRMDLVWKQLVQELKQADCIPNGTSENKISVFLLDRAVLKYEVYNKMVKVVSSIKHPLSSDKQKKEDPILSLFALRAFKKERLPLAQQDNITVNVPTALFEKIKQIYKDKPTYDETQMIQEMLCYAITQIQIKDEAKEKATNINSTYEIDSIEDVFKFAIKIIDTIFVDKANTPLTKRDVVQLELLQLIDAVFYVETKIIPKKILSIYAKA